MTIGGGQRSENTSHARDGSKDWSKLSEPSNKNNFREEAKYGIGLRTMGGNDDDRSSRSSNDVELVPQSTVSVTIRSPASANFPESDQIMTAREHYHGKRLTKQNSMSDYPHSNNRIWQHREVEVTTEPVEPESMLPEFNSKRKSGI
ncbi:integral membrane protein [Colletotrichum tofieldiae]|nr:integral membrane protein [Colletotrichum tofieldiae]